jgi:site-specific DNA-methyltransferase (adenine-specific)
MPGGKSTGKYATCKCNIRCPDSGSAARFFKPISDTDPEDAETRRIFYCAKASKSDRNEGLEGFEEKEGIKQFNQGMEGKVRSDGTVIKESIKHINAHPCVKPCALMRYLCRLITPPGGIILDPFMGSGSTGKAAKLEGFGFIGIEQDA